MVECDMRFGLAGFGLYLPKGRESARQMAQVADLTVKEVIDLGIKNKVVPSSEDQPVTMAVKSAEIALNDADLKPGDIDLVIWTGEEYKDYIAQTASIRLQQEVGCSNAWAFDLVGQGITSILGLRVARDMMIGDSELNHVLLTGGTRNIDLVDYKNRDTRFLLPMSASGGSMILSRGLDRNRLLDAVVTVDSDMADEVYVPGGGTETPFAPDNLDTPMMFYRTPRPEKVSAYLADRFPQGLIDITHRVSGGAKPDYLALRHLDPTSREQVLNGLALGSSQSVPLDMWGHHGTNDPVLSLTLGLESGAVREGSLVALAAAGIGFCYAGATLRWGPV